MSARCGSLLAVFVVLAFACAGCSPALTAIPTGEWAGTGTYVEYEAHRKADNKLESKSKGASYATSLKITEGDLHGKRALFFEILSKRGKLMNVEGEETHITFGLVKAGTVDDSFTLLAMVNFQFNPSSPQPISREDFDQQSQIASAVCIRRGQGMVLQVNYRMPTSQEPLCFWDTFTFEGSTVRKTGRVIQVEGEEHKTQETVAIDWVEELHGIH